MNSTFAALATVLLLISGCAQNGQVKPPAEPAISSPVASTSSSGASSAGMQQASAGATAERTRAQVRAEALEASKHHKSTMQEELEYFVPH